MGRRKEILETIEVLQKELDRLDSHSDELRQLGDISDREKCEAFDKLFGQCYRDVCDIIEKGYVDDNNPRYIYEAAMELTLGKGVWATINAHLS